MAVQLAFELLLPRVVRFVALVYGFRVAFHGEVAVDDRVLACQVGLVEVVRVRDVAASEAWLDGDRRVGSDEHSDAACASSWSCGAFLVQGNVSRDHDRVSAIPRRGLEPVEGVEERIRAAVAGINRIHTLNVEVARLLEQLHQDTLDALGLVEERLRTHL